MGRDAGKFNFCLRELRRTPLHLGDARQSSVAARPTGDIVPAALSAFALEASSTALDARSTFKPERLVVFLGSMLV